MTEVLMPQLADAMEQGTIVKWIVEDGQPVTAGEELVEIETDKATVAYAAEADEVLTIVEPEGATAGVGEIIARIGLASEQGSGAPVGLEPPRAVPPPNHNGNPGEAVGNARVATPLVRRVAAAHQVALGDVSGTGPGGRVTKADVLAAAGIEVKTPPAPTVAPAQGPQRKAPPAPAQEPAPGARTISPTRLQRIVGQRMTEAKATVPHFLVQTEAEMDAAVALRAELKASAGGQPVPSVNDIIVRAAALALRDHQLVNGSFVADAFELHDTINVGIAVAADDGLVVVTVRDADSKSLGAIAADSRALAQRVRSGLATPTDLSGATFTVSNPRDVRHATIAPVINPPQAAILGVGATRPVLARVDGEIVDRQMLSLTLSCDHRILNGADGSRYLADVKALLETPLQANLVARPTAHATAPCVTRSSANTVAH